MRSRRESLEGGDRTGADDERRRTGRPTTCPDRRHHEFGARPPLKSDVDVLWSGAGSTPGRRSVRPSGTRISLGSAPDAGEFRGSEGSSCPPQSRRRLDRGDRTPEHVTRSDDRIHSMTGQGPDVHRDLRNPVRGR
ncbi:Hypothetical predicted protein [Marmota monax]|uniref:Uncharacterized protein n=1 Tax=Marmota monax TaxID=9995 RepID=A0A5E4BIK8_MARMO|nr:Hypothetical predicted protein [Marmota monax]